MDWRRLWIALIIIGCITASCSEYRPRTYSVQLGMRAFALYHTFGGFNITNAEMAIAAARDGINESHSYAQPADTSGAFGQTLTNLHMHEMDGYLWTLLYEYECHRSKTVQPMPGRIQAPYCPWDFPFMTGPDALLALVAAHLKQAQSNGMINGYWVLDDWPTWDSGSAKYLLQQIHSLVRQYTPGIPTVCGFGGAFGFHHDDWWYAPTADNFSPEGCDIIGLYNGTAVLSYKHRPPSSTDQFDWTMSTLLPEMFATLRSKGWSPQSTPWIGIGQATAGTYPGTSSYVILPSVQNMVTQALSYCKMGAYALYFDAWDTAHDYVNPQTPFNNSILNRGVQLGVAACKHYWGMA